jgi:glycosyltransferase involved in cell wall biosynthesis
VKLLYLSLMRFPTEKAHGLQIMQNCEAFAEAGASVELWVSSRSTPAELAAIGDAHAYYGVSACFTIRRVPSVDLYPWAAGRPGRERLAFYVATVSYLMVLAFLLTRNRADVYYSRDEAILWLLRWLVPRGRLVYEAHLLPPPGRGRRLQASVARASGLSIAITAPLRDQLVAMGARPGRTLVAHDGFRRGRFAAMPTSAAARQQVGWPANAIIVGFVGRLHMLGVDKGLDTLTSALLRVPGVCLAIVGGPPAMADAYRAAWLAAGGAADRWLYAGEVPPTEVPRYLAAMDICAMPHPMTEQYAYYTSPLKLFEYMAAGRAIVASDLPAWRDVLTHEVTALLVPPDDADALGGAISRLQADPALRERIGRKARETALERYTWDARAGRILQAIREGEACASS